MPPPSEMHVLVLGCVQSFTTCACAKQGAFPELGPWALVWLPRRAEPALPPVPASTEPLNRLIQRRAPVSPPALFKSGLDAIDPRYMPSWIANEGFGLSKCFTDARRVEWVMLLSL